MITVIDTNILVRLSNPSDPDFNTALSAVTTLHSRGDDLRSLPQNLYEFWVAATRPAANNGLGLTIATCSTELAKLEGAFPPLIDPSDLLDRWKRLVVAYQCSGKTAHDARIVAAMELLGITRVLTFNGGHFARYPDLTVIDPHTVSSP